MDDIILWETRAGYMPWDDDSARLLQSYRMPQWPYDSDTAVRIRKVLKGAASVVVNLDQPLDNWVELTGGVDVQVECPICGRIDVVYTKRGRAPIYCSRTCKAARIRRRRNQEYKSIDKADWERKYAQGLYLMTCKCGRGIFTVMGNVTIGRLICGLCAAEFTQEKGD